MFLIITFIGLYLYFKGDKYKGLIVFLFLLTDGFQLVPAPLMLFGLNLYGKDYALVFSLCVFLGYFFLGDVKIPHKNIVFISIVVFLFYLTFAAVLDLGWYNPYLSDFFLMFRVNLFLFTFFWLSKIEISIFERIFKLILKLTILQAILCLFQIPTGLKLLTGGGVTPFMGLGISWVRYTNLPYFLMPCLFITILNKKLKIPYKNLIIILFLCVIFFTLTRTLILGLLLTISAGVILGLFKNQKKIVLLFTLGFILSLPIIGSRLMSSTADFSAAINQEEVETGDNLTFTYRILHSSERFIYVCKSNKERWFGIGFIHERHFPQNTFFLGHKDFDDNYRVTQLEQDDISWSNLFLRFGVYGTLLYFFMFISFCIYFYKNKDINISGAALLFMTISFVLTFASGRFSQADFFVIPMFFFFYIKQYKQVINYA